MKNLLDTEHKNLIIKRIDALQPTAKALWGKMNVNQALRHMAVGFEIPLGSLDPTLVSKPQMPKWLMKFFLLNLAPPREKAETFKEMNMVENNIFPTDFEAERKHLKEMLDRFVSAKTHVPINKVGGKFDSVDWGKLHYNHLDHHLRQFGA